MNYTSNQAEIEKAINHLIELLDSHQKTLQANLMEKKLNKNEHYIRCRNRLLSSLIHLKNLKSSLKDEKYWS
jgi:RNA binding exosome subunit